MGNNIYAPLLSGLYYLTIILTIILSSFIIVKQYKNNKSINKVEIVRIILAIITHILVYYYTTTRSLKGLSHFTMDSSSGKRLLAIIYILFFYLYFSTFIRIYMWVKKLLISRKQQK